MACKLGSIGKHSKRWWHYWTYLSTITNCCTSSIENSLQPISQHATSQRRANNKLVNLKGLPNLLLYEYHNPS